MSTPAANRYRMPRACPVCTNGLHVTQLACAECGTGLSGAFSPCEFCALSDAERELLMVFLTSRGNLRSVARHLGVSAPTARARYDELVAKLGVQPEPSPTDDADDLAEQPEGTTAHTSRSPGEVDPRLQALRALARGEIDLDTARGTLG